MLFSDSAVSCRIDVTDEPVRPTLYHSQESEAIQGGGKVIGMNDDADVLRGISLIILAPDPSTLPHQIYSGGTASSTSD